MKSQTRRLTAIESVWPPDVSVKCAGVFAGRGVVGDVNFGVQALRLRALGLVLGVFGPPERDDRVGQGAELRVDEPVAAELGAGLRGGRAVEGQARPGRPGRG